jgi:hypothetical protein
MSKRPDHLEELEETKASAALERSRPPCYHGGSADASWVQDIRHGT